MEHEIPSRDVLHDKEEMVSGLEAGVESSEEGRLGLHRQHLAFVQSALHIIFLDDQVLLQTLNGVHVTSSLVFRQKHLCYVCVYVCTCVCLCEDMFVCMCVCVGGGSCSAFISSI